MTSYHNSPLPPSPIPMSANISDPAPLAPDAGPHRDLGVQLHADLEIALQDGFGDGEAAGGRRLALESAHHRLVVALLVGLRLRGGLDGRAVDGFMEDRVVRVVLFHGGEVVGALEQVLALAGGVLRPDGLAVDALGGEALRLCCNR